MSSRPRKWRFRIEAIGKIRDYTQGMTLEQFCSNYMVQDAVIRNFEVIGATRHIPPEVEDAHPEVPWGRMRGMRNVLAHEYESVDLSVVWGTVQRRLPPLVPLLQAVLDANDFPDG